MANPVNFNSSAGPVPASTGGGEADIQAIESEIGNLQARLEQMTGASETKHVGPTSTTILPPDPSPRPPFPFPDIWIQIILRRIMELIRMLLELLQRRRFGEDPPPPVTILRDKAPGSEETSIQPLTSQLTGQLLSNDETSETSPVE